MPRSLAVLTAALVLFALPGCDLGDAGTAILATGTVLDTSLDEPADGVNVALVRDAGLFAPSVTVASVRTDAGGRFRLEHDPGDDRSRFEVVVNTDPYDETYAPARYSIRPGDRSNETTRIYRYVSLTVIAEPERPLRGEEYVFIQLPVVGRRSTVSTTTRARGNAFNEIRIRAHLYSGTREIVDSVYCPVGEVTEYQVDL